MPNRTRPPLKGSGKDQVSTRRQCRKLLPVIMGARSNSAPPPTKVAATDMHQLTPRVRARAVCREAPSRGMQSRDSQRDVTQHRGNSQDRYAGKVIQDASRFDAIEVHEVCEFLGAGGETYSEADCDSGQVTTYSVYAHLKNGGIDCCGDFGRREEALNYGIELAGENRWPLYDHTATIRRTE